MIKRKGKLDHNLYQKQRHNNAGNIPSSQWIFKLLNFTESYLIYLYHYSDKTAILIAKTVK